jgi:hypothetical protein
MITVKSAGQMRCLQVFRPADFARLIAKVAYGMAVYLGGYDVCETRYVVPCILDVHFVNPAPVHFGVNNV